MTYYPEIIRLEEVDSTSRWLADRADSLSNGQAVTALRQVAGRGQRGNSWESEPGRNLTMSVLLQFSDVPAIRQFSVSEAVALAVVDVVRPYLPEGSSLRVKWPNDIYVGDRKICGTLIENRLSGSRIERSIAGIGLNVNQREFFSDAPNPVSIIQLTGEENAVDVLAEELRDRVMEYVADCETEEGRTNLHRRFLERLWRRPGLFPYSDTSTGQQFEAEILDVEPTGHLILRLPDHSLRRYAFKEVAQIIR